MRILRGFIAREAQPASVREFDGWASASAGQDDADDPGGTGSSTWCSDAEALEQVQASIGRSLAAKKAGLAIRC
ncbi:MAG: hypothetical protein MUF54_20025 [Polyangiaceae bacterium]|jgi:hypothetical protein|nr:hypothetical protein [Polyangiaceae bacterium]